MTIGELEDAPVVMNECVFLYNYIILVTQHFFPLITYHNYHCTLALAWDTVPLYVLIILILI